MAAPSTSQLNTNVNIKIKVLTDPEDRNSKYGGPSIVFSAIDSNSKSVKEVFGPQTAKPSFKVGKFYMLKNVVVGEYVRMLQNTKVMQCTKFDFTTSTEEEFYSPPEVSVAESLRSPSKRRLSVTGILTDESDIKESGGTRRKILKLTSDDKSVDIKLWGDQVQRPHPPIGSEVVVTCVKVNEYKGQVELNGTVLTDIKELCTESGFSGMIEAVDFDSDMPSIMLEGCDDMLHVTTNQLQEIFPEGNIEEDVMVTGTKLGLRVLAIWRTEDEDVHQADVE